VTAGVLPRVPRARMPDAAPIVGHPGGVPYPDKLLAEDEEVVRHLHPHWLTIFWPVVRFLLIVGAASFGAGLIPPGRQQGIFRMIVLALALILLLTVVLVPLLRWRTTHYVITTHRLLFREGILARRGRDIGLSRITDVSYRQTLWERIINSGTLSIESAGEGGPTVLGRIPDSDGVQQLLNHMVEEDADRRARESADYLGEHYGSRGTGPQGAGSWPADSWDADSWDADPRPDDFRTTRYHGPH
jgi:membrane protein YdbS with pleckstrin-like domain